MSAVCRNFFAAQNKQIFVISGDFVRVGVMSESVVVGDSDKIKIVVLREI